MKLFHRKKLTAQYFFKNFFVVVGVVFIWRGIWLVLDGIDAWLFGGSHVWTGVGGIIVGLVILYWPDKDLKELGKL